MTGHELTAFGPDEPTPALDDAKVARSEASGSGERQRLRPSAKRLWSSLSWLDRLLAPLILIAMIIGVVIGKFANNVEVVLQGATLQGVSIPIVVGLLVMMWPILTKVQYERLPAMFRTVHLWRQIGLSLLLNWILGPFVMLAVAWATLPDQPTYRTGVIMVGLARCIAMVMIWNQLARGDTDCCAIIVIINSVLQIILYSPMSLFFVNVISREHSLALRYGETAIAVLIYLGIPLLAGVVTRFAVIAAVGRERFNTRFLPYFGPLALLGLLYTIILICAEQATRILDNIGLVFRVFVPLIVYFIIMWTGTFVLVFYLTRRRGGAERYGYEMAVVQAFTAGSNKRVFQPGCIPNPRSRLTASFELAIAVCVAVYGINSDQALAATIGPLVEVPVLLSLTYVSLYLRDALQWGEKKAEAEVEV